MFGKEARNRLSQRATAVILCTITSLWLPLAARADEFNRKTIFTFSAPVEIPGKVLPAGPTFSNFSIPTPIGILFQGLTEEEKEFVTTLLAVSDYRMTTPEKTLVMFEERPSDSPEALKAWSLPRRQHREAIRLSL